MSFYVYILSGRESSKKVKKTLYKQTAATDLKYRYQLGELV